MEVSRFRRSTYLWATTLGFQGLTLLICLINNKSVLAANEEEEMNCTIVWSDGGILEGQERWNKVDDKCLETSNFDTSQLVGLDPNTTTLEEFDIDDNCYVKCTYEADGILTSDGSIDKQKTATIFKGTLTPDIMSKVSSAWEGCIDDSGVSLEKIAEAKGLSKCKMLTLHDFCFLKRAMFEAKLFMLECK